MKNVLIFRHTMTEESDSVKWLSYNVETKKISPLSLGKRTQINLILTLVLYRSQRQKEVTGNGLENRSPQ